MSSDARAARLPTGRKGQAITAGMWNQHVATINRLGDGVGPPVARVQQGDAPGYRTQYSGLTAEAQSVDVPILDNAGVPTGDIVRADVLIERVYQASDGSLITFTDAILVVSPSP